MFGESAADFFAELREDVKTESCLKQNTFDYYEDEF